MKINGIEIDGKITIEHNGRTFVFDDVENLIKSVNLGETSENISRYQHLSQEPEYHLLFECLNHRQLDKIEMVLKGIHDKRLIIGKKELVLSKYPTAKLVKENDLYYSVYTLGDDYKLTGCEEIVFRWILGDIDVFYLICEME